MQDSATGPSSKYSIPQRTSNNDSSLQFWVGNTAAGPKLFPHKDTSQGLADRSVIENEFVNSGNYSRGLDFIVGGISPSNSFYQSKLWRFFSWDGVNDPDSGNVERLSIGNSPLTTGGDAEITISASRVGIGAPSPSASLEINPPSGSFPSLIVSGSSEFIGNVSGSATSTASFGTYIGDGSQLSGISSTPFPFTGDAQITGSLEISGSLEAFTRVSTNVQIGNNAGAAFTTAANSVIIGQGAGDQITTGTSNTIIGSEAGGTAGTGILDNVFIGYAAGKENTSDSIRNVFIGYQAGYKQSGGYENVGIGYRSMANFSTTGDHDYNSALGAYTLYSINTGQYNVAIGRNAGYAISDGDNNILIGRNAGSGITYGGSNIIIGSGSLGALALEQQLRIGNGNSLVTISGSLETGQVIGKWQRQIITHTTDFSISGSEYIGGYNIVGVI